MVIHFLTFHFVFDELRTKLMQTSGVSSGGRVAVDWCCCTCRESERSPLAETVALGHGDSTDDDWLV